MNKLFIVFSLIILIACSSRVPDLKSITISGSDTMFELTSNLAAEFMKDNPKIKVSFEGHTDDVGSDDYNDKLSDRRAAAVKQYLTQAGIDAGRIKTKGFGKRKPLIKATTDEARAQNRRVEMKIES